MVKSLLHKEKDLHSNPRTVSPYIGDRHTCNPGYREAKQVDPGVFWPAI